MKDLLTADDFYSHIILLQGYANDLVALMVEGSSDSHLLDPYLSDNVEIVVGTGRSSVEMVSEKADQQGISRAVFLADADLDPVRDPSGLLQRSNLVYTERYDLDADIFFGTGAPRRVIDNFSSSADRVGHLTSIGMTDPIECIVRLVSVIGDLRLASIDQGYDLALRELPLEACLTASAQFDTAQTAQIIFRKSQAPKISAVQIEAELVALLRQPSSDSRVCASHDLHIMVRVALGWWKGRKISKEVVTSAIRAAVTATEFYSLNAIAKLRAWELSSGNTLFNGA